MVRVPGRKTTSGQKWQRLLSGVAVTFLLGGGLFAGVPLSCARAAGTLTPEEAPRSQPSNSPAISGESSKKAKATPTTEPDSYAAAIRHREFETAARLIDAASEAERRSPELRYARGRVALELSDLETALRSVDRLEEEWPSFRKEAESVRLAAAKKSLDVTLLAHFIGQSRDNSDLLLLAEAHAKSSSFQKARAIADGVLLSLSKSKKRNRKKLEARAHYIKAQSFEEEDKSKAAAKEYHWLATEGSELDLSTLLHADQIQFRPDEKLKSIESSIKLTSNDRRTRARAFSKRALVERTEGELIELKALSPSLFSEVQREALVAWALYYSRTDYSRAAKLFEKAAARGGKKKKELLYYEAKALARSHRDADAIEKYEKLSALGGIYAEHASYQVARLRFIDGQWKKAASSYRFYLKKYGKSGRHRDAALYDLPIARLAAKDFSSATKELAELRKKEDSPRTRARLAQLLAVSLLGEKKDDEAEALFKKVIRDRPLSYPALLSAARLREMKKAVPPNISPAQSRSDQDLEALSLSLPDKARRLSRVGLDVEAEKSLRSQESKLRAQYGPRAGEALCRLYGQLKSAKRRYQIAQSAASWSVLKEAPGPQTEWQWDCIYPSPYNRLVKAASKLRRVPSPFVYGIMRQESAFRPTVVSPAHAVGLMQIIPPTASRIALELKTQYRPDLMRAPAINISYGTYYLRRLLDQFEDRLELAAASYNAGPHAVTRWLRAGETLPLDIFVARIPYRETRNYVYRVMGNYARYAFRTEGLAVPEINLTLPTGMRAEDDAY